MKTFENKEEVESYALSELVMTIEIAIQKFGDARILLSGGSTPKPLYTKLANSNIKWSKVHIGLVDDRIVPITDDFSNEKMIRDIFFEAGVDQVNIYGIVQREAQLGKFKNKYAIFKERTDYTILGMGTDGHTASLFPKDKVSEALLNSEEKSIVETTSPQFPNKRITCSKGLIKSSHKLVLIIFGTEKKVAYNQAKITKKPITYFIDECPEMKTYYSDLS